MLVQYNNVFFDFYTISMWSNNNNSKQYTVELNEGRKIKTDQNSRIRRTNEHDIIFIIYVCIRNNSEYVIWFDLIYTNALFVLTQWLLLLILFILILCFSFFCYFVHLQSLVMPHSFCVVLCIQIISICLKINGFIWLMVITAIHCVGSQIDFSLRSQFFQLDFCFFSCQLIILFYLS